MAQNQIPDPVISKMMDLISIAPNAFGELRERLGDIPVAMQGIDELEQIATYLLDANIPQTNYQFDFSMVRGLAYYTGPIYETVVVEPKIGSLTGGGRYDELIGLFSNQSIPVTGTSFGIERIIDVMEELAMFPATIGRTVSQAFVTIFSQDLAGASIRVANQLETDGLGKQLKYAAARSIPFAVIIGPDESGADQATVRDLASGEQTVIPQDQLSQVIAHRLQASV
jgi:histidyl-tRNA synthetase